jgi:hypothetical protein
VAVPLGSLDPADSFRVRSRKQIATGYAAKIIRDDVMVADALADQVNAVEELNQLYRLDDQAGLFTHLADYAGGERLAHLEQAAGQRPLATKGFGATADEKDAVGVDDHGSDANEGRVRIFSLHHSP